MISREAKVEAARRFDALLQEARVGSRPNTSSPNLSDVERIIAVGLLEASDRSRRDRPGLTERQARAGADRLVGLEWRAVQAETVVGRLRGRRLYRVADVLAGWVRRPWRLGSLFGGLGRAWSRVPLPELPVQSSRESFLAELRADVAPAKGRPLPYSHVRVAHVGGMSMFGGVASHFDLAAIDVDNELAIGFDMLLIEPGAEGSWEGLDAATLRRFRAESIPVLLMARTRSDLDHQLVPECDLVLTEDPELADLATGKDCNVFHIHPSVDDTVHNPIGWKQTPKHELLVIGDHPAITSHFDELAGLANLISLHGPPIPGLEPAHHNPQRPTGAQQAETAKQHHAAYTTPQLTATPTSHIQLVLELIAAGTPVITHPNPTLDEITDNNYLTTTSSQQTKQHLETLKHPPTRERHSIPARRHILTNHTRKHRFEQILHHLDIPTNPTPKTSILLATKRPDHIEHALNSITTQNWPNKELVLILHGEHNFDLAHIKTLTQQLPYPNHTIICPDSYTLGDCLNTGLDQATGTYITKMDDDDHYGPNHLTDLHTAHTYSNTDIVGKLASVVHLEDVDLTVSREILDSERYHQHVAGPTLTGHVDLFNHYRFLRRWSRIDTTLLERVLADGGFLYITHPYGFILERRESGHTWELEGYRHFVKNAVEIDKGVADVYLEMG